jgi:hypothetical protein
MWLVALGCQKKEPAPEPPPAGVKILDDTVVLKSGSVGVRDPMKPSASYVLVDVENGTTEDRTVAIEGTLAGDGDQTVGPLPPKELFIPAGARRTYALVSDGVHTDAKRAHLSVRKAPVAAGPPIVTIDEVKISHDDEQGTVAEFKAVNAANNTAVTTVIASFHDDAGHILARPFSIIDVDPKSSREFRLAGPKTATHVDVYTGEIQF